MPDAAVMLPPHCAVKSPRGNYFGACDGDLFLEERQFSRGRRVA